MISSRLKDTLIQPGSLLLKAKVVSVTIFQIISFLRAVEYVLTFLKD